MTFIFLPYIWTTAETNQSWWGWSTCENGLVVLYLILRSGTWCGSQVVGVVINGNVHISWSADESRDHLFIIQLDLVILDCWIPWLSWWWVKYFVLKHQRKCTARSTCTAFTLVSRSNFFFPSHLCSVHFLVKVP